MITETADPIEKITTDEETEEAPGEMTEDPEGGMTVEEVGEDLPLTLTQSISEGQLLKDNPTSPIMLLTGILNRTSWPRISQRCTLQRILKEI